MKRTTLNVGMILCREQPTPLKNGSLIIEDGIVREILPRKAEEALYLEGAEEVSLPHMTLMLGMIKCHNHLRVDIVPLEHLGLLAWSSECQLTLLALKGLKEGLMDGVTIARCMGSKFYIDMALKKLTEGKKVDNPHFLAADTDVEGGHGVGHVGIPHCGAGEIRYTCREDLKKGADLLKLFIIPGILNPTSTFVSGFLSLGEISATVSEDARLGIPTAAHCIGGQGPENCIGGGADVTERIYMVSEQDVERPTTSRYMVDLTSGVFLDPNQEEFLSPANALKARLDCSRVRENVTRTAKVRLPFVLETDVHHGFLYREVGRAVELGASPVATIQGVASHATRVYRLEDRIEKLEDGIKADVIAVEENPLKDVSRFSQAGLVMKGGVVYKQP